VIRSVGLLVLIVVLYPGVFVVAVCRAVRATIIDYSQNPEAYK
jgi:hypothetical protein